MKIISDPWLATIVTNTLFDFAAAVIAYYFIKQMTKPASKAPIIAFALWILNPFNIIFSVQALPIVIVNFFIILVIFLSYYMCKSLTKLKTKSTIILSILLGLALGLANWFRPIFIVFIIALGLYLLFTVFAAKKSKKLFLLVGAGFVIIILLFTSLQKLNVAMVSTQTGLETPASSGGWSIYVGANWKSDGNWDHKDGLYRDNLVKEYSSCDIRKRGDLKCDKIDELGLQAVHDRLQREGIERYKSYGISGTLSLFVRKLYSFSGGQTGGAMRNANQGFPNYKNSKVSELINIYIQIFITLLFVMTAIFLFKQAQKIISNKQLIHPVILLLATAMLGFFLSDALVESNSRYAQVLYPLFIILATLFINDLKSHKNRSSNKSHK
ncbi:MAG: hypothetical protein LBL08_00800 [Candidatus Nomurabacteria bacterium]|nr:hypothetical protein [Candidatus Nomurabacteria bacterium]